MYKTLLVFNSYELLEEIKKLEIWGGASDFIIEDTVRDGRSAYKKMKEKPYDLVITEINVTGIDGLQLLRHSKDEGLCSHIVLCSEIPDFGYARQGIILGAFDYCVPPFEKGLLLSVFDRIKNETTEPKIQGLYKAEELIELFEKRDENTYGYIFDMLDSIYAENKDILAADKKARALCRSVMDEIFKGHDWLDLYTTEDEFYGFGGISENDREAYKNKYKSLLSDFFDLFLKLFPRVTNTKLQNVIVYILHNPEGSLRQKTIAEKYYINSSYLSTVFAAQTEKRFVDYLTTVKLSRAAWLLKETDMRIADIAERLDYKDMGYFSRLFKKEFDMTPSEYRIPDGYNYQI